MTEETASNQQKRKRAPGGGRPAGSVRIETSDLVERILTARGGRKRGNALALANDLGFPYPTLLRYLNKKLIPTIGEHREKINAEARKHGIES